MERRNWSLKAFSDLQKVDTYEDEEKAEALVRWTNTYLDEDFLSKLDLQSSQLYEFIELFYKNINFIKGQTESFRKNLNQTNNIKKFLE
jgi:regulator of sirC expression with transglutaminase-like and TPR domain